MDMYFTNSLGREKQIFKPIVPGRAGIYSCGPTVYMRAHIGNFRAFIFADLLRRTLEVNGYTVKHIVNITDVGHLTDDASQGEDKLQKQAKKIGASAWEIAKEFTQMFVQDMRKLNLKEPAGMPKATDHIEQQIAFIQTLEEKGFTYVTSDGVYFETAKCKNYGMLSGQAQDEKREGARVEINEEKHSPSDFALWKFSPQGEKRHMEWDSPWGIGFPGWHIECSAMSEEYLGVPFDIHTGGIDHIPIHHANEMAQTEAAREKPLAHYWLHNAFLTVSGGKMSKSLGTVYTIEDIESRGIDPLALRFFFLGAHYRQTQNFTWEALEAANNALQKLRAAARDLPFAKEGDSHYREAFLARVNDDLDFPGALAVVFALLKDMDVKPEVRYATLMEFDEVLGLDLRSAKRDIHISEEVQELLDLRKKAREEKNWELSDEIREQIESHGLTLKDTPEGQIIE